MRKLTATAAARRGAAPYRVMVVDDSAVIRGLLTRTLESDGEIQVVASAGNGQMAIDAVNRADVELMLLDMAMPVMDGMTALPLLFAARPQLKVIIVSTLTRSGAAMTFKALAAGAADYITKPDTATLAAGDGFRRELILKVKALGEALRAKPDRVETAPAMPSLRALPREAPHALAIGASTGGPMALYRIFEAVRARLRQPIFITQHMPATFTAIFAAQLARVSGAPAAEGVDGEAVRDGHIYVAPGDHHMMVETAEDGSRRVRLSQAPPENFCRPSVDPMLRSLTEAYGGSVLVAMLTGMGQDGLRGAATVVAAGGAVVAQDQASSVVWGMPGAVVSSGLACAVPALDEIGPLIARLAARAGA